MRPALLRALGIFYIWAIPGREKQYNKVHVRKIFSFFFLKICSHSIEKERNKILGTNT